MAMKTKKGMFFTIDSLLASGIIITVVLLVSNFYLIEKEKTDVSYASQDVVKVFSTMTVGESNNDYVKTLISSGLVSNINNTILEQVGDFWASGNTELATNFTKNLTESIFPPEFGYSILVNGEQIYSRSKPVSRALVSSAQMISGIAKGKPKQGFTTRAILSGIKSKKTAAYAYFGGYEGDGNISKKLILPANVISFNSSYVELGPGGNFSLYINGLFSGSYAASGGDKIIADKYNISNAYLPNFKSGENLITINFTSGNSYIAGGFLKVTYTTSSFNDTQSYGSEKYFFPGIDGVINLYSSIFIPGPLNNMAVFLNYSSNYTVFLEIGNTTVFSQSSNGTINNITITNATLSSLVDYSLFSQKTIPLRLGLTNTSNFGGVADTVLVTDVSGSMDWCSNSSNWVFNSWQSSNSKGCLFSGSWLWGSYSGTHSGYSEYNQTFWNNGTSNLCGCRYHTLCQNDSKKIDVYINSSLQFAEIFFNLPGNRLGLVEYSDNNNGLPVYNGSCSLSSQTTIPFPDGIVRNNSLVSNKKEITDKINTTGVWWGTCTCCGINKAAQMINLTSYAQRKKFIVLMSDGAANVGCTQQPNSTPIADAVQSASDACNQGIAVYAIAFGADADTATMKRMNCSGGKYYDAVNVTNLQVAYNDIAGQINKLAYSEQSVNISGILKSAVYPDSYIQFNYTPSSSQFNKLPLAFESARFGNNVSTGILTVFPNTSVSDAKVTSYSGIRWTDNLVVNGNQIYKLSDYGSNYQSLGDPFIVGIPAGNFILGNDTISISTGINSTFSTNGSSDDRVIYTLLLNGVSDYTSVLARSNGCSWTVNFEDGTSSVIGIPQGYSGASTCDFSAKTYDNNDTIDEAVFQLFSNLDIDRDGKLDVNVDGSNINLNTVTFSKVPSLWGPAIVELRVWQ